jgi:hypothetical protein
MVDHLEGASIYAYDLMRRKNFPPQPVGEACQRFLETPISSSCLAGFDHPAHLITRLGQERAFHFEVMVQTVVVPFRATHQIEVDLEGFSPLPLVALIVSPPNLETVSHVDARAV